MDFSPKRSARGREQDAINATILGMIRSLHPTSRLHAIEQAGNIRTVHYQTIAELPLTDPPGLVGEDVEHIILRTRQPMRPKQPLALAQKSVSRREHGRHQFEAGAGGHASWLI